jgi:hypothetical protein
MRRRCDCRQYGGGCDDGFHWFTYLVVERGNPPNSARSESAWQITKRVDVGGLAGASLG